MSNSMFFLPCICIIICFIISAITYTYNKAKDRAVNKAIDDDIQDGFVCLGMFILISVLLSLFI